MNKGIEAFYEGMRVKMRSTFIWWKARLHDGKKKKKFKIKFVVLNLTLYICTIQLAPEGVAGILLEKKAFTKRIFQPRISQSESL